MPDVSSVNFNFSKLVVGDLEKAAAFYGKVFQLQEQARVEDAITGRAIREVMYEPTQAGGATFVLLAFDDTPRPAAGEAIIGFTVSDIDAVLADLTTSGGAIIEPIRDMPHLGIRVAFAGDPEGHLLEIVQFLPSDGN